MRAHEQDFRRIHGPYELVFMPVSGRGFALFRKSVNSEKGSTLITNDFFLLSKYDGNYFGRIFIRKEKRKRAYVERQGL